MSPTTELSLDVDQVVDASPETVFRLLTEPELYRQWFGPDGADVVIDEMEVVLGGRLGIRITFPGTDIEVAIEGFYEAIEPPNLLVHTWRAVDEELVTTVRFQMEPQGAQTRLTVNHRGFVDATDLEQNRGGWSAHLADLARMAAALEGAE